MRTADWYCRLILLTADWFPDTSCTGLTLLLCQRLKPLTANCTKGRTLANAASLSSLLQRTVLAPVREEPAPPVIFPYSCHDKIACKYANNFRQELLYPQLFFQQVTYLLQKIHFFTWRRRSCRSCFLFLLQTVHALDHEEDTEGHDQKVDNIVKEHSVFD